MTEDELREIEARRAAVSYDHPGLVLVDDDVPALINEVRRLSAVVAEYADHGNWGRS